MAVDLFDEEEERRRRTQPIEMRADKHTMRNDRASRLDRRSRPPPFAHSLETVVVIRQTVAASVQSTTTTTHR